MAHLDSEILIGDNASIDSTLETIAKSHVRNLRIIDFDENLGFAKAVNRLASLARGDRLLLLNPDCTVRPDTMRVLDDVLASHADLACVGPVVLGERGSRIAGGGWQPSIPRLVGEVLALPSWLPGGARLGIYARRLGTSDKGLLTVDWVAGTCLLVARADWEAVGGLSEDWFMYCEDMDLGRRLTRIGRRSVLAGSTEVQHVGGASHQGAGATVALQATSLIDYYGRVVTRSRWRSTVFRVGLWAYFATRWLAFSQERPSYRAQMSACWGASLGVNYLDAPPVSNA